MCYKYNTAFWLVGDNHYRGNYCKLINSMPSLGAHGNHSHAHTHRACKKNQSATVKRGARDHTKQTFRAVYYKE